MKNDPLTVTIILDPEYGERLREAALSGPVWIGASATNRSAVENYWRVSDTDRNPVTYWSEPRTGKTTEEWLGILDDLELHHPDIAAIHVIGAALSEAAQSALREFGYQVTESGDREFRAMRVTAIHNR
jgi:hypothetical protein